MLTEGMQIGTEMTIVRTAEVFRADLTTSPSASMEGEISTEKAESGTGTQASRMERVCAEPAVDETNEPEKVSKINTTLPDFKDSSALPKPDKRPTMLMPHPPPSPGWYECEVCQMHFYSYPPFVRHKQTHDGHRPFPCGVCGKRFLNRSHYIEHQRVHTGERPFSCEHCERSFTTSHNLKRHLTIHSKEDMFRCKMCDVLFCHRLEHYMVQLQPDPEVKPELEPSSTAPPNNAPTTTPTNNVTLINKLQQNPMPRQSSEVTDDTQSTPTPLPLPTPTAQTLAPPLYPGPTPHNLVPPPSPQPPGILHQPHLPPPPYPGHSSQPRGPPPPYPTHLLQFRGPPPLYSTKSSSQTTAPPPPGPRPPSLTHAPPPPCPRPSRRICIPISLTSTFLEVKRNCKFTRGKTSALWFSNCNVKKKKKRKKKKKIGKRSKEKDEMNKNQSEASSGLPLQIIAYDIEVVL